MKIEDAEKLGETIFDLLADAANRANRSIVEFISSTSELDVNDIASDEYAQQQIDDQRTGG